MHVRVDSGRRGQAFGMETMHAGTMQRPAYPLRAYLCETATHRERQKASVVMQRMSYLTETVLPSKITRNIIVLSFKDSPRKPLGRRPREVHNLGGAKEILNLAFLQVEHRCRRHTRARVVSSCTLLFTQPQQTSPSPELTPFRGRKRERERERLTGGGTSNQRSLL